jgi:hypothetical protein
MRTYSQVIEAAENQKEGVNVARLRVVKRRCREKCASYEQTCAEPDALSFIKKGATNSGPIPLIRHFARPSQAMMAEMHSPTKKEMYATC